MGWPVSESHTRAVPSSAAVTIRVPSVLNAADQTIPSWRSGGVTGLAVSVSQTRAVPSSPAVISLLPPAPKTANRMVYS